MFCPTMIRKMEISGGLRNKVQPTTMLRSTLISRQLSMPLQFQKQRQSLTIRRCLTDGNHQRPAANLNNNGKGNSLNHTLEQGKREQGKKKPAKDTPWIWGTLIAFGVVISGASINVFLKNSQSDPPEQVLSGSIDWQGKAVPPYTLKDVNAWFKQEAISWSPDSRPCGVVRCDGIRLKSNEPCEDQMVASVQHVEGSKKGWLFWGVFDGHKYVSLSFPLHQNPQM